eukprot:4764353-Alexandrium_andersonii.AAC.1
MHDRAQLVSTCAVRRTRSSQSVHATLRCGRMRESGCERAVCAPFETVVDVPNCALAHGLDVT